MGCVASVLDDSAKSTVFTRTKRFPRQSGVLAPDNTLTHYIEIMLEEGALSITDDLNDVVGDAEGNDQRTAAAHAGTTSPAAAQSWEHRNPPVVDAAGAPIAVDDGETSCIGPLDISALQLTSPTTSAQQNALPFPTLLEVLPPVSDRLRGDAMTGIPAEAQAHKAPRPCTPSVDNFQQANVCVHLSSCVSGKALAALATPAALAGRRPSDPVAAVGCKCLSPRSPTLNVNSPALPPLVLGFSPARTCSPRACCTRCKAPLDRPMFADECSACLTPSSPDPAAALPCPRSYNTTLSPRLAQLVLPTATSPATVPRQCNAGSSFCPGPFSLPLSGASIEYCRERGQAGHVAKLRSALRSNEAPCGSASTSEPSSLQSSAVSSPTTRLSPQSPCRPTDCVEWGETVSEKNCCSESSPLSHLGKPRRVRILLQCGE